MIKEQLSKNLNYVVKMIDNQSLELLINTMLS